jgi:predicted RNA binding protein YcfA (HicA-like mRNA interferase family)
VRIPRDLDGRALARALGRLGYEVTRQTGSHMRLTTSVGGTHHVTVPDHRPLRVGTLSAVLAAVGAHHGLDRESLQRTLFGD